MKTFNYQFIIGAAIVLFLCSSTNAFSQHILYEWQVNGAGAPVAINETRLWRNGEIYGGGLYRTMFFVVVGPNDTWTHMDLYTPRTSYPFGTPLTPGGTQSFMPMPSQDFTLGLTSNYSGHRPLRIKNTYGQDFAGECFYGNIEYSSSNCILMQDYNGNLPFGTYTIEGVAYSSTAPGTILGIGSSEVYVSDDPPPTGPPGTRGVAAGTTLTFIIAGTGNGLPYSMGFAIDSLGVNPTMTPMPPIPAGTPLEGVVPFVLENINSFAGFTAVSTPGGPVGSIDITFPTGPPGTNYRFWVGDAAGEITCEVRGAQVIPGNGVTIPATTCIFNPSITSTAGAELALCNQGVAFNDLCVNALPLPPDGIVYGCFDHCTDTDAQVVTSCLDEAFRGLWYTYEGDGDLISISTCGSQADTQIDVYVSSDGTCAGAMSCATDFGIFSTSYQSESDDLGPDVACPEEDDIHLKFRTVQDTTYFIYISTPDPEYGGSFTVSVSHNDVVSGCMDQAACNYDPAANWDDGSCEFASGCTSFCATNYDPIAICDDGSCLFDGSPCLGCTDPTACGYDEGATEDDGSCLYNGCSDPASCNYDDEWYCDDDLWCDYSCFGCADSMACNYDPSVSIDDGSCAYDCYGCLNSSACNYDDSKTMDDALSCCFDNCLELQMFDAYGDGWNGCAYSIINSSGVQVASGDLDSTPQTEGQTFGIDKLCLLEDCYILSFTGGIYIDEISVQLLGTNEGTISSSNGQEVHFSVGAPVCKFGCTDPAACNYDIDATNDDGTCCNENCLTLDMTDAYGDGWNDAVYAIYRVVDSTLVVSGSLNQAQEGNHYSAGSDLLCLADDCYFMHVGGGTSDDDIGWALNGALELLSGSVSLEAIFFSVGSSCQGCLDDTACNFDPVAMVNDPALCEYSSCAGCTYADAENYDPTATIEDGSCEFASCGGAPESPISIVSEVFYTDDGTVSGYPAGFTTYRIYAEMEDAADFLVGGFAFDNDLLSIGSTTNTIWNNGFGAETGDDIDPGFFLFDPSMEYDSFVTIGRATSADPGGDITAISSNPIGAFADHFGTTVPGVNEMSSNFSCSDGSWLTLAMESNGYGIGPDNRILLAQVTTDGELEYNLNLQYIPASDPLTQVNVVGDCGSVEAPELDGSCAGFHVPENPVCCADPVVGCTYLDAENYDDLATIDDGSCTFVLSNPCPTDLNGDCEVNTGDLLMLLSDFGMWCEECWD